MTDKPGFPWARLAYAALNLSPLKNVLKTTINGIERDPALLAWVEQFQKVDQKDCLICIAHRWAVEKRIALKDSPPEHWCPTRKGARVCGCGKPATRKAQYAGIQDRDVCEEFPGCVPGQKVRSGG